VIGIIWNYRGVAKKGLSTFIKELVWVHKADFIGIQKTMKKNYSEFFFSESLTITKSLVGFGLLPIANLEGCLVALERIDLR